MNAVGIIAEYNPLHNGHAFHLKEARRLAGADAVVVAMSGDFVQRGEPAILNKWARAKLAVQNGADVVIEIPAVFCLQSANVYAKAGVSLLKSCGISKLAFGSESGDSSHIKRVADNLNNSQTEIEAGIRKLIKDGYSYPRARQLVYNKLFNNSDESGILEQPNDILAVEYARNADDMELIAIKRQGCGYNDAPDESKEYQSSTAIRDLIASEGECGDYVPEDVYNELQDAIKVHPDDFLKTLKYAVLSMSAEDIDKCPSGGEGIGNKIKSSVSGTDSWNEMISSLKSKRYTYTRLSRLCMQIVLGINGLNYESDPEYIRILALSEKGRKYISELCDSENVLPVITNVGRQMKSLNDDAYNMLNVDIHAADIYNFVSGADEKNLSDYRMRPYIQE